MIGVEGEWLYVGGRRWWGTYSTDGSATPEMRAEMSARLGYDFDYQRRQFIVRFESKWRASIIWGSMTYSDNHDHGMGRGPHADLIENPILVEVGVLHADRENLQPDGEPIAYIDEEQVNAILDELSKLGTDDEWLGPTGGHGVDGRTSPQP